MGQWTPEFHDQMLASKIKSLVSGAITRLKLEALDPCALPISYERFVAELETGDSFTTSLIDILVKEVAERRKRPTHNQGDHRLIAETTAKSLRMLATPLRIYHATDDDDDEFESMLEDATDGSRQHSELYDAYSQHPWPHSEARRFARSYSAIVSNRSEESSPLILPTLPSPPVSNRSGPWALPPPAPAPATSSLTRRQSTRRPPRVTTSDFADFTSRRRSTIRETLSTRESSSTPDPPGSQEPPSLGWTSASTSAARRFFPFHRYHRLPQPAPSSSSDGAEPLPTDTADAYGAASSIPPGLVSSTAAWYLPPLVDPVGSPEPTNASEDIPTPRLRRGGIRAPESLLAGRMAPATILNPINVRISTSQTSDAEEPSGDGAATYPTPSSVDNDTVVQTSA